MNKKSLLGLILFACIVITGLFAGANFLISLDHQTFTDTQVLLDGQAVLTDASDDQSSTDNSDIINNTDDEAVITAAPTGALSDITGSQESLGEAYWSVSPSDAGTPVTDDSMLPSPTVVPVQGAENPDTGNEDTQPADSSDIPQEGDGQGSDAQSADAQAAASGGGTIISMENTVQAPQLIVDSTAIDYMDYIPEMLYDKELKAVLDIDNPKIDLNAEAAILFDAETKKVLYYKNPVQAMFPASTAKLLTSLVALKMCTESEQVSIGDEITMIASDSTRANIREGEILTIRNLLEGMLLPSGNDAAYAIAAYVGRKSLDNPKASKEAAIAEFVRLMNEEAKNLGVKNSCFKTPDGYDAIGQYTTAYDMGLIGMEAAENDIILEITGKKSSRNIFVSGRDVTWYNTNQLLKTYSKTTGLKTGTSTMAGGCLVAAAESNGRKVVCVVMKSKYGGRWEDALDLLKYGLK